jgi:hypothetical protein
MDHLQERIGLYAPACAGRNAMKIQKMTTQIVVIKMRLPNLCIVVFLLFTLIA